MTIYFWDTCGKEMMLRNETNWNWVTYLLTKPLKRMNILNGTRSKAALVKEGNMRKLNRKQTKRSFRPFERQSFALFPAGGAVSENQISIFTVSTTSTRLRIRYLVYECTQRDEMVVIHSAESQLFFVLSIARKIFVSPSLLPQSSHGFWPFKCQRSRNIPRSSASMLRYVRNFERKFSLLCFKVDVPWFCILVVRK